MAFKKLPSWPYGAAANFPKVSTLALWSHTPWVRKTFLCNRRHCTCKWCRTKSPGRRKYHTSEKQFLIFRGQQDVLVGCWNIPLRRVWKGVCWIDVFCQPFFDLAFIRETRSPPSSIVIATLLACRWHRCQVEICNNCSNLTELDPTRYGMEGPWTSLGKWKRGRYKEIIKQ